MSALVGHNSKYMDVNRVELRSRYKYVSLLLCDNNTWTVSVRTVSSLHSSGEFHTCGSVCHCRHRDILYCHMTMVSVRPSYVGGSTV